VQAPTLNRITQTQHLASKAVDHADDPDPIVYATEDGTIDSYQQRGSGTNDAGMCLRMNGANGLHQFAHLETSYVAVGQKVVRGQKLAKMGYTGYTLPDNVPEGAHLHYWIRKPDGTYVYPPTLYKETFIGGDMATITNLFDARKIAFWNGRNGYDGRPNALRGDTDADLMKYHVGKELRSVQEAFYVGNEGKTYREVTEPAVYKERDQLRIKTKAQEAKIKELEAQLGTPPIVLQPKTTYTTP